MARIRARCWSPTAHSRRSVWSSTRSWIPVTSSWSSVPATSGCCSRSAVPPPRSSTWAAMPTACAPMSSRPSCVVGARPTLCYLCPTYQNPTGAVLSEDRRRHLGELAARYRFVVIDDDPYRDPRVRAAAHPPPRARARRAGRQRRVVLEDRRTGSARRLGPRSVGARRRDGHHEAGRRPAHQHIVPAGAARPAGSTRMARPADRRARRCSRRRGGALVEGLTGRLGRRVAIEPMAGGMFVWATLPECPVDTDALLPRALEHGVAFVPGSAFDHRSRPSRSARLCCATLPRRCSTSLRPGSLPRSTRRGRIHARSRT